MRRLLLLVVAIHALTVTLANAQSLGDVAKKEEARRKTIKSTGKIYTNDSLPGESAPSPAAAAAPPVAEKPAPTPQAAAADAKAEGPKQDEAYWRQRISSERDALKRSQMFAEALQSRINALTADFVNRDDPAQRAQIGNDRQQALAELDRVKKEIVTQTRTIADTEEEARKAGVPPGWLR